MNRTFQLINGLVLSSACYGQVYYDRPVMLDGPPEERRIDGLAHPVDGSAAITVNGALLHGNYTWCSATLQAGTIELSADPPITTYSDGLLLRFTAPDNLSGTLNVRAASGLEALPLLRPDGTLVAAGQLTEGAVCEVVHAQGRFYLLHPVEQGCPSGFQAINARVCMEIDDTPGLLFHAAMMRCADLGGKLCTWDEYLAGCNVLQGQLVGMFDQWEWIDESSDHTHGADQVGNLSCLSHRQLSNLSVYTGDGRCCYHPR